MSNLTKYKTDLQKLIELATAMQENVVARSPGDRYSLGVFEEVYQRFYSEATSLIRQILPSRLLEFESLYKADPRRKTVDAATYSIQDWLLGMRAGESTRTGDKFFDDFSAAAMRFQLQFAILQSLTVRFESSLTDIRRLTQADLFDSELDAASELLKHGFQRGGGVVAGVVLEKHLREVCDSHSIPVKKKNPTIGDLNDTLKDSTVIDIPTWRSIQRLGDLRNLCGHNKEREPTAEEVSELIEGCAKITKTVY